LTDNTKASDTELRKTTKRNERDATIAIIDCNDKLKRATGISASRGLLLTPLPPNRAKQSRPDF
jgi:hypothetical protein